MIGLDPGGGSDLLCGHRLPGWPPEPYRRGGPLSSCELAEAIAKLLPTSQPDPTTRHSPIFRRTGVLVNTWGRDKEKPRFGNGPLTFWGVGSMGRSLTARIFPLLATLALVAVGLISSIWVGPHLAGKAQWQLPDDLWGTLLAARRLAHLDIGGLYGSSTGLVALPGAALILVPVVAVLDAAGIGLGLPGATNAHPTSWLLAGPYEIVISASAIFAADAIARRFAASKPKRAVLAASSAVALWSVSIRWGHPEDAVAVALLMYATLALADSKVERSAWLLGAGVAIQPLVLLAVPVLLVALEPRRMAGYLSRVAAPSIVLLGAALAANWNATFSAVVDQPNWPMVDHPTPFVSLAPRMSHGAVAAGPGRAIAVAIACACAVVVERRTRGVRKLTQWTETRFDELLWWVAVVLAVRCVFESVMVAYYVWPALAFALAACAGQWRRLLATSVAASVLTFVSQASWHGRWTWWSAIVALLALTLDFARIKRPALSTPKAGPAPTPQAITSATSAT